MRGRSKVWYRGRAYFGVIFGVVAASLLVGVLLARPVDAQEAGRESAAVFCATQQAVPRAECEALLELYQRTDGPHWVRKAGWLVEPNVCAWAGVTCAGGRVVELNLSANRLQGPVPRTLSALTALSSLQFQNNSLAGPIPFEFCKFQPHLTQLNLDYNLLSVQGAQVAACVDAMDPGWQLTQTTPPQNIVASPVLTDGVTLHWQPISYTADGGYYEISLFGSAGLTPTAIFRTPDKLAASITITGLDAGRSYEARVATFTPAHDAQPADHRSVAPGIGFTTLSAERVLVMVYFSADNDLDPYIEPILERLRRGTALNHSARVIYLADGSGAGDSRIWEIAGGVATLTGRVAEWWGQEELNTADAGVLARFLRSARTAYGADATRTVVSLVGHGVALAPELAWVPPTEPGEPAPAPQPGIPALPRGIDYTPTDVTDGAFMSTPALGEALLSATDDGANPFDLVFFDQCFQGNLDILYEVRSAARVFVASPNYAWLVAPYQMYLPYFAPAATPEEMANAIIRIYQNRLTDGNPNAIFWVRGSDIGAIADAVSNLGDALRQALGAGKAPFILQAAQNGRYADTTQCGRGNLHLGPPDELIGAERLAENLRLRFSQVDADDPAVVAAATGLLQVLDRVPSTFRVGYPYIEPNEFWNYDDTITLLAPLLRETPAGIAWRASIYRPTVPLPAVWTPDPQQEVLITQPFAFVQDGRWDEFLAEWYTAPMTPTVGEWCNYVPPAVVISGTVEEIDLTAVPQQGGMRLAWSQPGASTPAAYHVLVRKPDGINEVLLAIVDATVQDYVVEGAANGTWLLRVAAVDESEAAVAISQEVQASTIYLPVALK